MKTQNEVKKSGLNHFSASKLSEKWTQQVKGGNINDISPVVDAIVIEDNFL